MRHIPRSLYVKMDSGIVYSGEKKICQLKCLINRKHEICYTFKGSECTKEIIVRDHMEAIFSAMSFAALILVDNHSHDKVLVIDLKKPFEDYITQTVFT